MDKSRTVIGIAAVISAFMLVGCSSSDDGSSSPSAPAPSGANTGTGGGAGGPAGGTGTGAPAGTSGPTGTKPSLYERLGKKDGIAKAVTAVVDEELKDTELASYFYFQVQDPIPDGHPSRAQIEECFTLQLASASGGPEKYPAAVSGGFTCRDMVSAHKALGIPSMVFDRFIAIAAGVLKVAGVADDDIKVIGGVLVGEKKSVAQDTSRESGPFVPPDDE